MPTYTTNNIPRPWLTYSDMDLVQQRKLEKLSYNEPETFSLNFYGFEYKGLLYPFEWFLRPYNDGYCYPCDEAAGHLRIKLIERDETVIVERLKK